MLDKTITDSEQNNNAVLGIMVQCFFSGFNITIELLKSFAGVVAVRGIV